MGDKPSTPQVTFVKSPRADRKSDEMYHIAFRDVMGSPTAEQRRRFLAELPTVGRSMMDASCERWDLVVAYVTSDNDPLEAYFQVMVGLAYATECMPNDPCVIVDDDGTDRQLLAEMVALCDRTLRG